MKLSIIIPAYNEEKAIGKVLDKIKSGVKSDAEIIVVDDGSKDNTAREAMERGVKVVRHAVNQGKGVSIRHAVASAEGEFVLFLDGDGQDDPGDIPKLLRAMNDYHADFVIGSRWLGTLKEGAISRLNFSVTDLITKTINLLFKCNVTDSQAGFRCVRKDKIKKFSFKAKGYDIETEMLVQAVKHKLRIVEVPVTRFKRPYGRSKLRRFRLGIKILSVILRELFTP